MRKIIVIEKNFIYFIKNFSVYTVINISYSLLRNFILNIRYIYKWKVHQLVEVDSAVVVVVPVVLWEDAEVSETGEGISIYIYH